MVHCVFQRRPFEGGTAAFKPPLESFVEDGNLIVRSELPGIDPKDITVSIMDDVLTIRARREEEHETKKRNFLHREFKYGAIERLVNLPKGVKKTEEVKASFTNGLLELKIPMSERGHTQGSEDRSRRRRVQADGRKSDLAGRYST